MFNLKIGDKLWITYKKYLVISEGKIIKCLECPGNYKIKLKEKSPFGSFITFYSSWYLDGSYDFERFFLNYEDAFKHLKNHEL